MAVQKERDCLRVWIRSAFIASGFVKIRTQQTRWIYGLTNQDEVPTLSRWWGNAKKPMALNSLLGRS